MEVHILLKKQKKIQVLRWLKPAPGRLKLNLDGSSLGNPGSAGGGGVLRDSSGNFIFGFSKFFGSCSNNEAELRAVVEGISICKHLGHDGIDIECDPDIVVSWIWSRICNLWYLWDFWDQLIDLLEGFDFSIHHFYREGNKVVDTLSRYGTSGRNNVFSSSSQLPRITNVVGEPSFADRGCKPKFVMEFDYEEIAYKFYNEYVGKMGFNIRKEAMVKNKRTDHDLVQFFKHFERVLNDKRYKELEAEYALCQKKPQVQRPIKMLIEAGKVYTKIIFEEFQDEFMSALEFYIKSTVDDGEDIAYIVFYVDTSKEFPVIRKKIDNSLSCSCRLFEMNGVLCGHAIKILREVMNLKELPSEYILKRWTRKARSESVKDMDGCDIQVDARLQHTTWYRNLCSIFTKIYSRGVESEETYKVAVKRANELSNIIEEMLSSQLYGSSHENDDQGSALITDNDSNRVQAKGFKNRRGSRGRKRMKSQLEIAYMRKLRQLSNKGSRTAIVQAKGMKRKSQALKGKKEY
ncbi:hypothetical protein EZV62_027058 [Acer yangbiense]|uniref:Protein FAR1-RELATED SEQUENCE n=1 Tax=Acer yangbiense TaxID=1000413 RepID=A0A5C7GSM1_9ROSI|nr:hypothetical protein EZV62_027058 [Acer yangbiense]